jgi:hypothetical protein
MKYKCEVCGQNYKNKKKLKECLIGHFEEADDIKDFCQRQLEKIGINNPYI